MSTDSSASPSDVSPSADAITRTVTGLGYDLVDVQRLARGLLRVTIDRLPGRVYGTPGAPDAGEHVTVEDCERVTRQLQLAMEVAGIDYARLEVSSPGLDRPLKTDAHCRRFAGSQVSLTLKQPLDGRKHWSGVLVAQEPPAEGWRLVVSENKTELALDFQLDELRELQLVPVLDFKGRRNNPQARNAAPAVNAVPNGDQDR